MSVDINLILDLMRDVSNVRNAGFAGHIDHGKTTATDCLLAYCNIIAPFLAGHVRYLDYLDMEQKRGITIKSSVISIPIEISSNKKYLLNLIDTPGHVDFSGKVSRALRLMDGVIIVVDAVEGIMAQTEAYLKLALEEHVKPLLYINKLDRLITELSMSSSQIQTKLEEIIVNFNEIINMFGEDYQKERWNVDPVRGSVIFGSALYCWGFTLDMALQKGLKFDKIIRMFKENPKNLSEIFPLGKTFANIIYKKIPDPKSAQSYRLKYLWSTQDPPSDLIKCSKDGVTTFYVSKCIVEAGRILAIGRVFSGKIKASEYICLNNKKERKVDAVRLMIGASSKFVNSVYAGNVFGAFINANVGETYADKFIEGYFRVPRYLAVPVVFVAIEPKYPKDFEKLLKELEIYKIEDPNMFYEINKETGEILLGGIGELHLEIILNDLSKKIDLYATEPMVAYREMLIGKTKILEDDFIIEIESVDNEEILRKIITGELDDAEGGNIIKLVGFKPDEREAIKSIIINSIKNGPLIGEPVIGCMIKIIKKDGDKRLDINKLLLFFVKALSELKTEIAEPYYLFEISTKPEYLGSIISEIDRRGGKIKSMEGTEMDYVKLRGIIPVRTSIGLPSTIRAIAHGRAYIQLNFYNYLIAEGKAKERVLSDIRLRKGLD